MKLFKLALMLGVLGLWLGASNHCLLETLPGFKFLICAPHGESAAHQDRDCDNDACAAVEKAAYKIEQAQASAPPPLLVLLPESVTPSVTDLKACFGAAVRLPSEPSWLPMPVWQLAFRTVAPPRAPSFVS